MGLYKYLAAAKGEAPHEILIEADSIAEAQSKLRSRKIVPVRYCGEATVSGGRFTLRRSKVNTYEFTRQLAPLLDSHIPLERALAIIADSSAEAEQRDFVNALRQGLHEGKKFSELARSHGTLFPGYYANLIESGEETGCLPEVVNELHKFMGESKELKDFIVSSSIYPLAILTVTMIVTVVLFTVFVPRFAKIFIDMGREMPPSMEFLLAMSSFFSWAWWLIPLCCIGGWLLLKRIMGERELRIALSRLVLKLPLFGRIVVDLEMCKYIRTLAILIANHVEIIRTVRISGKIISESDRVGRIRGDRPQAQGRGQALGRAGPGTGSFRPAWCRCCGSARSPARSARCSRRSRRISRTIRNLKSSGCSVCSSRR